MTDGNGLGEFRNRALPENIGYPEATTPTHPVHPHNQLTESKVMAEDKKPSNLKIIKEFFGFKEGQTMTQFGNEYKELSDEDKEQLARGIEDETLDY